MKKSMIAVLVLSASFLTAAPLFFPGGEILAAELSSQKVYIRGFDSGMYPDLPQERIYAAVTMLLPEKRKMCVTDFKLSLFGREYPCVAIRVGDGAFDGELVALEAGKDIKYTLLFILDKNFAGLDDREFITLYSPGNPESRISVKLPFTNLRENSFTASHNISFDGSF